MIAHRSFRAMGTEIELVLDAELARRSRSTGPKRSSNGWSR